MDVPFSPLSSHAGVKAAQRRGVRFGRELKLTRQQIDRARKLIDDGQRREGAAALLNVDRTTPYRAPVASLGRSRLFSGCGTFWPEWGHRKSGSRTE